MEEEENGKKYGRIQYIGIMLFVLCMLLQGPASFLPDQLWVICLGIAIGGFAGSLVNNNSNAAMMHTETKEARRDLGDLTESQK